MKRISMKWMAICLCCVLYITHPSSAQNEGPGIDEGDYYKRNTALTEFLKLGVSNKQYAKCVRSVNFDDPSKILNVTTIDKTEFRDDGQGNDLVANDGILTTTVLFTYGAGEQVLSPGTYGNRKDDYILADELFEHGTEGKFPWPRIFVKCKTRWQRCNELPHPASYICMEMGPPYGSLIFYDCETGFSL